MNATKKERVLENLNRLLDYQRDRLLQIAQSDVEMRRILTVDLIEYFAEPEAWKALDVFKEERAATRESAAFIKVVIERVSKVEPNP